MRNSLRRSTDTGFAVYFATLAGDWRIRRRYCDGSRFEGLANFLENSGSMVLTETGTLYCAGGEVLAACRSWTWLVDSSDRLRICFRDPARNGTYHNIPVRSRARGWYGSAGYDCGADHYRGWYVFDPGRIVARQSVKGPHKNYAFVTKYLRVRCN